MRYRRSFEKARAPAAVLLLVFCLAGCSQGETDPMNRYYRAVYVLQSLGGHAATESESLPDRVRYSDETESLLHHPDKRLVLERLADDLAAARPVRPRAQLFEAYARLALGERDQAASLLMSYVVENEYHPAHYALLSDILRDLEDNASLLLISREWSERDPVCREERALNAFAALFNLGRLDEAARYLEEARQCLAWRAPPRQAKLLLARGQAGEAEALINAAASGDPEHEPQIRRAWGLIRDREKL
jgi:hypothetical protein